MFRNEKILIVEDDAINIAVIERQLVKLGYSIAGIVRTGEEAVECARKNRPDLVLMDVELEGEMDGIEAAAIIRKSSSIPVVYLTANSDDQTIERARSTEAYGYLHKPFQEREVHSTVQMALYKAELEARLREERQWLSTTIRCISDGIIATDATGAIKLVNPTAERLTGWKQQEALGRDLTEVFRVFEPDSNELAECAVTRLISQETAAAITSQKALVSRAGKRTVIEQSAASIVSQNHKMIGVVLVFHPVQCC